MIPMYNEEKIARFSLETIISYTRRLPPVITVLVVNDGSQDATEEIVKGLIGNQANEEELYLISHPVNQGYGASLRSGMNFAIEKDFDYALFMDSDLTNHPKYLEKFYEKMLEGYDYIKATRYREGSATVGVPLYHRILSVMGNFVAASLYRLPLTDLTNGFRAVKVEILKKMNLSESGFSIIMEELYYVKYLAESYCDIPYVLTSRGDGQGKSKFSYGPRTYYRYLKYPVKSSCGNTIGVCVPGISLPARRGEASTIASK